MHSDEIQIPPNPPLQRGDAALQPINFSIAWWVTLRSIHPTSAVFPPLPLGEGWGEGENLTQIIH